MSFVAVPSSSADVLRMVGTLALLMRSLDQRVRAAGHAEPLSIADLSVLRQIERGVDLPSTVARALRLDPARLTHIADRLVERGYIERALDPEDRRRWRLRLTEAGTERLRQGQADIMAVMDDVLGGISVEERAELAHALQAVRRVLDTAADGAE